jgi:hypothetical protein
MNEQVGTIDALYICNPGSGLDPITVFWQSFKPGQGIVTITCSGSAWTAGFWAMPEDTIQKFFNSAGVGYLTNKLTPTHLSFNQTQTKRQDDLVGRIVKTIKEEMSK